MKWSFSSGGCIKVYNDTKQAWFNVTGLKISVSWTEEFTLAEWNEILVCVKEAKKILKRIRRL